MKFENVVFVPVEEVERLHEDALQAGQPRGTLDRNLLLSAVEAPKATFDGQPLYRSLAEIAATYAWGLARNHAFADGNKRTALLTALTFLAINGHRLQLGSKWVDIMVRVASDPAMTRAELIGAFAEEMSANESVD